VDLSRISAETLAAAFDGRAPLTVGLEEEVMLLDPETLDLLPCASELLRRLSGDPRFKAELPEAQVEILTPPLHSTAEALAALAEGRRVLADAARGLARPAAAGVHPFAAPEGKLASAARYERVRSEYGSVARRQLVAALQVHVAVGDAERTLQTYNRLRPHLPHVAALAANAAFYEGRDTGLASVRPQIAESLPRQGMPPAIASWEQFAAELRWGAASGAVPEPRLWWWELRPHPGFGTLEVRVPDAQSTLADAAGVVAFVHSLVAALADDGDAGEPVEVPTWRIEENRWSAARYGTGGEMADLHSGQPEPTRQRLRALVDELEPVSGRLGSPQMLEQARRLIDENGAVRQRRIANDGGARGIAAWLADHFLDESGVPGSVSRLDPHG
jgi:glutamate---cysteine ligase / carboxylate-amine ligase